MNIEELIKPKKPKPKKPITYLYEIIFFPLTIITCITLLILGILIIPTQRYIENAIVFVAYKYISLKST